MAIKKEQKNRVNESGGFDQIFYQTSADQVLMADGTTAEEKIATKADLVGGKVPVDQIPDETKRVFIATYGTTTNDEIYAAHQAGKFVYCVSGFYILPLVYCTPSFAYFRVLSTDGSFYYRINCATDAWSNQSVVHLESRDNKVTAISADSTDDDYPSAKAVYDALGSKQDALIGEEGQMLVFDADGKPVAQDAPSNLPAGGTMGQVLTKKSEADYDVQWDDSLNELKNEIIPITRGGTGNATAAGAMYALLGECSAIDSAELVAEDSIAVCDVSEGAGRKLPVSDFLTYLIGRGFVRAVTGSYAGTGVYGSSNRNTLTFDFAPTFVYICSSGGGQIMAVPHFADSVTACSVNAGSTDYGNNNITWNGATMTWYCSSGVSDNTGGTLYASAYNQMNESGKTYYYFYL